jgi:bis(5'-nucleosidyl)-tetraphosphatase
MKKLSKRMEVSAGIIPVRLINNEYNFLLLRSGNYWDFPKGNVESSEDALDAALREVEEETTITPKELNFKWGKQSKTSDKYKKGTKFAVYFIAETDRERIELPISEEIGKPEHDEYRWVTYEKAKKLANKRIKEILSWANNIINE